MDAHGISIVVPVYNSADTLARLVPEILSTARRRFPAVEIVLVNDASSDGSSRAMAALQAAHPEVVCIDLPRNVGQYGATLRGIGVSTRDTVATMDDDGEHAPADLLRLHDAMLGGGFDLVCGVPGGRPQGVRSLGSRAVDWLFEAAFAKPRDVRLSSFRIMNSRVAGAARRASSGRALLPAILLSASRRIGNVEVSRPAGPAGRSRYTVLSRSAMALRILAHAVRRPR